MEQAERLYRGTRLRAATDNVGLARLRDGTELVRVGAPLRPEFAAWRYGDQFGRRRRRRLAFVGGAVAVAGAAVVAGPVMGLFSLGGLIQIPNLINVANQARRSQTRVWLEDGPERSALSVTLAGAEQVRIVPDAETGFAVSVPTTRNSEDGFWGNGWRQVPATPMRLTGARALRAASRLLPHLNRGGGSGAAVHEAVAMLDQAGGPDALYTDVAAQLRRQRAPLSGWTQTSWGRGAAQGGDTLASLAAPVRLALEMAAHEEQERRALDGELRELEAAWHRAEEIAAIADDLLVPERVETKLGQLRSGVRGVARGPAPRPIRRATAARPAARSGQGRPHGDRGSRGCRRRPRRAPGACRAFGSRARRCSARPRPAARDRRGPAPRRSLRKATATPRGTGRRLSCGRSGAAAAAPQAGGRRPAPPARPGGSASARPRRRGRLPRPPHRRTRPEAARRWPATRRPRAAARRRACPRAGSSSASRG
jgi:hypothetical protein